MPDQLRGRFDALRSAVEHTDAPGLGDVRARRTRRARTRVAVATAASVAALALAGVVVLPQLAPDSATTADGAAMNDGDESRGGDEAVSAEDQVAAEQAPTDLPTEEPVSEEPPVEEPPVEVPDRTGPFTVTADSLLTWEEIVAAGESGPGTVPYGATLVFPGLCGAENAYAEYSGPDEVVAKAWVISDGVLTQSDLQYESDQQASDALSRLSVDAQACPVVNEFASITHVGSDSSVGAEIAFFDMRLESGEDGSISTVEISVTRIANVLVEVVLRPDGPTVTDADDRSRALAQAAVTRVVSFG